MLDCGWIWYCKAKAVYCVGLLLAAYNVTDKNVEILLHYPYLTFSFPLTLMFTVDKKKRSDLV